MRTLLLAAVLAVATVAVAAPAEAGGWAVTTLDPLASEPVAGRPFEVGFTIRQHGRTPITVDDAAILVSDSDGTTTRFEAAPDGAIGHHVAVVQVPAGTVTWAVDQGLGIQELGTLTVGGGGDGGSPWTTPLLGVAVLLAGLGLAALVRGELARRRSVAPA